MAKVTVGESVATCLEPYDDSMELAKSADARMMDMVVDDPSGNHQIHRGIDAMSKGDDIPGGVDGPEFF